MELIGCNDNVKLLGDVKPGEVVRWKRVFWIVTRQEGKDGITLCSLKDGSIATAPSVSDVEVFSPKVFFSK